MIQVTLKDGSVRSFEKGISIIDIARNISHSLAKKILIAKVNNQLTELHTPLKQDARLELYTWEDPKGKQVFWHSSSHVMAEALLSFFPTAKLGFGPPIEQGFYYDVDLEGQTLSEEIIKKIEEKFLALAQQNYPFVMQSVPKKDALAYYQNKHNTYKTELIEGLKDGEITFCTQGGFTDLCKGGHLLHTGYIKAFKITNIAGAYWRGDEKNKMLTRLYGISFPAQKLLDDYLLMLEEAKKRDHRKIGKDLELFTFSERVGSGLPLWLPKGAIVREKLQDFLKNIQLKNGYQPVITPHIGHKNLYITSGHYEKYGADSFQPIQTPRAEELFFLKPMNCPHHCEIYKAKPRSYKDLPLRLAEFGTVYRYEQAGELHGLTRVRCFTQDDAHLFCRPDQIKEEFIRVIDLVLYVFTTLGFSDFTAQISLRDLENRDKYIGSEDNWRAAEQAIIDAAEQKKLSTTIEHGEAAFYGPKLDFMVKDALGRKWQLGTIQVDYNLPERFDLTYVDSDNQRRRPVMIHRAPFGSLERFLAVLLEHTAGKLPLWLAPMPCIFLPVSDKFLDYAQKLQKTLQAQNIAADLDDRTEKIGKKIRDAELQKIPYMLIIGEKEMTQQKLSVRRQGEGDKGLFTLEAFITQLQSALVL